MQQKKRKPPEPEQTETATQCQDDETDLTDEQSIQQTFGDWCYGSSYKTLKQWFNIFTSQEKTTDNWNNDELATLKARGQCLAVEIKKLPKNIPMKYCPGYTSRGEAFGIIQVNTAFLNSPIYVVIAQLFCMMWKAVYSIKNGQNRKTGTKNRATLKKSQVAALLHDYGMSITSSGKFLKYTNTGIYSFFELLEKDNKIDCPTSFTVEEEKEEKEEKPKQKKSSPARLIIDLQKKVENLAIQLAESVNRETLLASKIKELTIGNDESTYKDELLGACVAPGKMSTSMPPVLTCG